MRTIAILAPLFAATAAISAPPHAAPRHAAYAQNWATTVTRTPAGAYVLGNPRAKVRLVEYASLTCSHCAAFAAEGYPALRKDYIGRGLVSLELRHAVRDRADLAASLLARCKGPAGYFPAMERIFAAQGDWLPRAAALPEAPPVDTPAGRTAALVSTASGAGLPAIAGLSPAAANACIGNAREQAALSAMASEAWGQRKITGTPAFFINDKPVEAAASWDALAPALAAAVR